MPAGTAQTLYDAEMIRTFLEHLHALVRVLDHATRFDGAVHPELAESLIQFALKCGSVSLVQLPILDPRGATAEEINQARSLIDNVSRERFGKYLAALETLGPLFEEALDRVGSGLFHDDHKVFRPVKPREAIAAGGDV